MKDIGGRSLVFLMLSGLATGASWLCYYKALQVGQVAKVVTIDKFSLILTFLLAALFLGEKLTLKTLLGGVLITAGHARCGAVTTPDKEYKWKRILTALSSAQAPAGLSAALNLRQRGKTVLVVHSGETLLAKAEQVDNYLGMPGCPANR